MIRLSNQDDFFEMRVSIEEDKTLQSYGDAHLKIAVCSRGFCGNANAWAHEEEMKKFCTALVALNNALSGEAILESMSPNELLLKVLAVNSRGHMGVEGSIGNHFFGENRDYWHSVAFGFEFDPAQLAAAVQLPWVRRYAG